MTAIHARFDGEQVVFSDGSAVPPPGDVVIMYDDGDDDDWNTSDPGYLELLSHSLAKVWDNPDDDVYNDL